MTAKTNIGPSAYESSGNWGEDNRIGRDLVVGFITRARSSGSPIELCRTLREMIRDGRYTGIEVGFLFGLVDALIRG